MDIATHQSGDFISYPTHRVVGTLPDATQAREVVERMRQLLVPEHASAARTAGKDENNASS